MPKEVKDIRDFLLMTRRPDVKYITIHKKTVATPGQSRYATTNTKQITKFKIRFSRYLYTLTVDANDKATKLANTLPQALIRTTGTKKKAGSK